MAMTVLCRGRVDSHRMFPVVLKHCPEGNHVRALESVRVINDMMERPLLVPVFVCPSVFHVEETAETGLLAPVFFKSLGEYLLDTVWIYGRSLAENLMCAEDGLAKIRRGERLTERRGRVRNEVSEEHQLATLEKHRDAWGKFVTKFRHEAALLGIHCEMDVDATCSELDSYLDDARVRRAAFIERNSAKVVRSGLRIRRKATHEADHTAP